MRTIKLVFASVTATLALVSLLLSLFLNTVLGVFGLTSASIATMQQLAQSRQVVEKMQARHQDKKARLANRHSQKAGRRIASTALAAATIGTVAVAVTVASLEVDDYCDAQRALQDDANVLYGSSIEFDLQHCVAQGLQNSEAILREVKNSAGKSVRDALRLSTSHSVETWQAVKQQALEALQIAGDAAYRLWDAMQAQLGAG